MNNLTNTLASGNFGLLLLGAMSYLAYSLRSWFFKLYDYVKSYFVCNVEFNGKEERDLENSLCSWLLENKPGELKNVMIKSVSIYHAKERKYKSRMYFTLKDNFFVIKYKGKRIYVMSSLEKPKNDGGASSSYLSVCSYHLMMYGLNPSKSREFIQEFLAEILDWSHNKHSDSKSIDICFKKKTDWFTISSAVKSLDEIILNDDVRSQLMTDLTTFDKAEEWYYSSSITYKRGYCFYGPPGTGKTSLAIAIARYLNKRLTVINLGDIKDDNDLLETMTQSRNTVVLLEDVDSFFKGREILIEGSKLTFSGLLNAIDGAIPMHNTVFIFTTNKIDHIDPALTRAGRIDFMIEIPAPTVKEAVQYIKLFFKDNEFIQNYNFENKTLKDTSVLSSMAFIQDRCLSYKTNPEELVEKLFS